MNHEGWQSYLYMSNILLIKKLISDAKSKKIKKKIQSHLKKKKVKKIKNQNNPLDGVKQYDNTQILKNYNFNFGS